MVKDGRGNVRDRVAALLREAPAARWRMLAFGLFWTWVWLLFQHPVSGVMAGDLPGFFGIETLPTLFYALGFLGLGTVYVAWRRVPHGPVYKVLLPASLSAGAALCWASDLMGGGGIWPYVLGCALVGVGTAALHTEWARLFSAAGMGQAVLCGAVATLFAFVAVTLLGHVPPACVRAALVLLPPAIAGLLFADREETANLYARGVGTRVHVPWKMVATAFVQGLSFGAMQAAAGNAGGAAHAWVVGFALASVALLAMVALAEPDFNFLIYHVGLPLMALGWLATMVVGREAALGAGLHAVGYRLADLSIWAATVYLIGTRNLPTNLVCAMNTCALIAGQFIGSLTASADKIAVSAPGTAANLLPALLVGILFCVSLFVYSNENLKTGWGLVRPLDVSGDRLDVACREVARACGLTNREGDVLLLLARGRNAEYICGKLCLSEATVRSYIKIVYRKLDVHSQQELISHVEKRLDAE